MKSSLLGLIRQTGEEQTKFNAQNNKITVYFLFKIK